MHMPRPIGTAVKNTVFAQDTAGFFQSLRHILHIEKHMIGNDPLKVPVRKRKFLAVQHSEIKIFLSLSSDIGRRIPDHSARRIGQTDVLAMKHSIGSMFPELAVAASHLQKIFHLVKVNLFIQPCKPSFGVRGMQRNTDI